MPSASVELADARVLISNDDGIHAPGLKVLEKVMRRLAREVWVVAPDAEQRRQPLADDAPAALSAAGRAAPLHGRRHAHRLRADRHPSGAEGPAARPGALGINRGGNLGEDATYSGTVAAAMEGTLLGIRSMALSQVYEDGADAPWATAGAWTEEVLRRLPGFEWPRGVLLNVNFPAVPPTAVTGIEVTKQGRHKIGGTMVEGTDPRGQRYFWIAGERQQDEGLRGTDLAAVHAGAVSVTPLCST